ncbi:MAG: VCBS repeat-containing protein [Dokdonella sp.]
MAYPVGSWPDSVAIFDVNGDGRNDVVLTTTFYFDTVNDYHVFVFLQAADGSLNAPISVPYPDHANSTGLAVMRVGRAAIAQSSLTSEIIVGSDAGITRFLVKRGAIGSGLFLLGQNSSTLAVIDANLDHVNDIVALSWDSDAEIFSGDGSGGFGTPLPLVSNNAGWNSMVARDFDNDGKSDLLIASGQGVGAQSINVHWQAGDGHLGPPTSFGPPQDHIWYAGAGDINGDGRADIVASRAYNSPTWLWYFKGQQGRTFAPAMALPSYDIPETVVVKDVNGDGLDDIVTLHGGWQEAGVYLQASDGGMGPEQLYDLPYASHYGSTGLALGDINSDGCTDAAIADYNNGLVVMYGHDCAHAAKQSAQ